MLHFFDKIDHIPIKIDYNFHKICSKQLVFDSALGENDEYKCSR